MTALPWALVGLALAAAVLAGGALVRRRGRLRGLERQVTQLAAQLDRRLTELFSLQELTYVLSNSIQLEGLGEQAARFLDRFIPSQGVVIALKEEGEEAVTVVAARGKLAQLAGERFADPDTGIVGIAMARNHLEIVEPGEQPPVLLGPHRVARAAVVPLHAHGATIGAIAVARAEPPFDQEELRLLSSVATHATIALSNARFVELIRLGKQQWETTFDAIADGIAVLDELNRVQRANTALARLMGTPVTSVIGRRISDALVGPSDELSAYLRDVRSGRQRAGLTLRDPKARRLLHVSVYPLRGALIPGWLVAVVEDITERTAMEAQLIQTEKMAAVGHLVSGVAHELNNPLTSIGGLAELLLQQADLNARIREHLRVIHEQADRAARIVGDLLTFARQGPTSIDDVDVGELVQRVVTLMGYELRMRKVDLELDLAPRLPVVRGDRYQLQQVMLNLITNAAQAVEGNPPERARRIRVTTGARNRHVLFTVEDTGPGVPEGEAPHIFDPFFTTKEPGEGTGLGLSITFGIVEGHDGRIAYRPASDGGAVFEVVLPAKPADGQTTRR